MDALVQGHDRRGVDRIGGDQTELRAEPGDQLGGERLVGCRTVVDDQYFVGAVAQPLLVGPRKGLQRALGLPTHVVEDHHHAEVDGFTGERRGEGHPGLVGDRNRPSGLGRFGLALAPRHR